MKHVPKEERESSANVYVSGGSSQLERLISAQTQGGVTVALVHFTDGALTHWHTHPGEQVLLVTAGECRFGNEDGEGGVAKTGDNIHFPPGERHWHGAVAGTNMTHMSITTVGGPNWMEPVTQA